MGWWSELWKTRAEDWVFAPLPLQQTPPDGTQSRIPPDKKYIHIFLKSMRIVNVRKGFQRFYGAVHSFMSLPHMSGDLAKFNVVTTPAELKNIDPDHLDRVVQVNKRLLGPIPYRGGDLEMEVGLFSIKSENLAAPYLAVLENLSSLAGVSFIKTALTFADPIVQGINLLTGASKNASILEIGLSTAFQKPETGYYIVMRAPKNEINVSHLRIEEEDFRLVDAARNPIADYPYMVFQIAASSEREAWHQIPELSEVYQVLQEDVRRGNYKQAEESLTVFKRTALTCNDLLPDDGEKIAEEVENYIRNAMDTTLERVGEKKEIQDLKDFKIYSD